MFKITKHAKKRYQQRGFRNSAIDTILKYGKTHHARGGALKIVFGDNEFKQLLDEMNEIKKNAIKAKDKYLIVKDEKVITMAHILHRI